MFAIVGFALGLALSYAVFPPTEGGTDMGRILMAAGFAAVGYWMGRLAQVDEAQKQMPDSTTANPAPPRAGSFGAYATTALKQSLSGSRPTGKYLGASDGFLHTYWEADVDWRSIWSAASQRGARVPAFGVGPYWVERGPGGGPVPLSELAFWGVPDRLRIANDPDTPPLFLEIMADDPDSGVRAAALSNG